ncbi:MAG: hypothetical protein HY868_25585 [Chloroflexi bacterium]|nr:hypothetical protein [Chloroflexota bacterium]
MNDWNKIRILVQHMIEEALLRFAHGAGTGPSATNVVTNVFEDIGGIKAGDAAGGDLDGTFPNPSVKDDSHNHTAATLPAFAGYTHDQGTANVVWTIVHNLGRYPQVTVVDSANTRIFGEVEYTNLNQVIARFSAAFSGKAYLV